MSCSTRKQKTYQKKPKPDDLPTRSEDVHELLVEIGNKYKETIVYCVGELKKDRKSTDLFRIKAVISRGDVIFFIRRDNLYLVGFQLGDDVFEFGHEGDERLIPKSTFLGYTGSYRDLGEDSLVNIRTDYWVLIDAVDNLVQGKNMKNRTEWINRIKKYLATAVVMFPECMRFKWVFVILVRLMDLGENCLPAYVKPWMAKTIHSWETMSKIAADLSKIAAVGSEDDRNPPVEENHLYTEADVEMALKYCIWAADALVVPCLFKVPTETLSRKKTAGKWWVTVKWVDAVGNQEKICEELSSLRRKFPNYDDGHNYY